MIKFCFDCLATLLLTPVLAFGQKSDASRKFDFVDKFYEGRAIVIRAGKCGFIDEQYRIVIPLRYAFARPFHDGMAAVAKGEWASETVFNGQYGFVDQQGREVIPFIYDDVCDFSQGIAAVIRCGERKWGGVDRAGNMVIQPRFDDSFRFFSDWAIVGVDRGNGLRFGYIDKQGKPVLPCQYVAACEFNGDYAWVEKDGEAFCIDRSGASVPGTSLQNFSWGGSYGFLTGAKTDAKGELRYGLLNAVGKELLPFDFDFISVYNYEGADYVMVDKGSEKRRYLVKGPDEIERIR